MKNAEKNNFYNIPLCDTHFHLIYPETIEDTTDIFRNIINYYDYKRVTLCCMAKSSHRVADPANNLKGLYLKSLLNNEYNEDKIFVYGSPFHFYDERDTQDGYLAQVKELYDMGVDGYKMLDGKPNLRKMLGKKLCDPVFNKMYAFMEEKGLPLKYHLGDPITNWGEKSTMDEYTINQGWWYGDGTFPTLAEFRDEIDGILTKFPKLKLCLAHFYFYSDDLEGATAFFERWENVSFDLTPGGEMFVNFNKRPEEWKEFFKKYKNRIFFGTDTYNIPISGDLETCAWGRSNLVRRMLEKDPSESFEARNLGTLNPMGLDIEDVKDIYYNNHKNLHPSARKLNNKLIAEKALQTIEKLKNNEFILESDEEVKLEIKNLESVYNYFKNI